MFAHAAGFARGVRVGGVDLTLEQADHSRDGFGREQQVRRRDGETDQASGV